MEEFILILLKSDEEKRMQKIQRRRFLRHLRENNDPFLLQEEIFVKNFRLSKSLCYKLIGEIYPFDTQKTSLPFLPRFLSALYFLAHGSYQKCVGNHCVLPMSQSSVSRSLHHIILLIIKVKGNEIKFPTSYDDKLAIKTGFYNNFGIKGTIGAIDCTHIAIAAPLSSAEAPLTLYMNRKGFYSINVEAICDHRPLFTSMNARFPGSCHDSGIWTTSAVRSHLIRENDPQRDTWLLGDQGYPLEPWLLTPLADPNGPSETKYNKLHGKSRNSIERAFGVLKSRFRCLSRHRILNYSHTKSANIIYACAILHNIIIKSGGTANLDANELGDDIEMPPFVSDTLREGELTRRRYISTL